MLATLPPLSVEFNDSFCKPLVGERRKHGLSLCDTKLSDRQADMKHGFSVSC
jgi:hypothetical protein